MKKMMVLAIVALPFSAWTASVAQEATPAPPPEKQICRAPEIATGSMLRGKRVCHTKSEWAQIDGANRAETDRALGSRNQGTSGTR